MHFADQLVMAKNDPLGSLSLKVAVFLAHRGAALGPSSDFCMRGRKAQDFSSDKILKLDFVSVVLNQHFDLLQ